MCCDRKHPDCPNYPPAKLPGTSFMYVCTCWIRLLPLLYFFFLHFCLPGYYLQERAAGKQKPCCHAKRKKSILSFVESSARTMKPVPSPPWAGFMVQVRNRQTKVCGRVVFLKQQLRRYRLSKKSWKTVYFFRKSRLILWTFDSWISSGEPSYSLLSVISCRKRHPVKQMLFLVL